MKVQTWITWATAALTIVYLILVASTINFAVLSSRPSTPMTAVSGAGCMLLVGFGFGWINAVTDYSRYPPCAVSTKGVIGWTIVGATLPTIILVFFGTLLVGSVDESLPEAIDGDPIGTLTTLLSTWFLILLALVAILGLIGSIVMGIYSSGLPLLATGVPVPCPVAAAIDGTIMTVGTIAVVFFADPFLTPFMAFLTILGVVIAAWGGVMLTDIALRRNDYDESSLFAPLGCYGSVNWGAVAFLIVGSLVGWGFVVNASASWLSWQGYLLDSLGDRDGGWAGANIGILLAMVVDFIGYWVIGAGRACTQEKLSSCTYAESAYEGEQ